MSVRVVFERDLIEYVFRDNKDYCYPRLVLAYLQTVLQGLRGLKSRPKIFSSSWSHSSLDIDDEES